MSDFLAFLCDACDAPFCERVSLMNLALGHTEDAYCLTCLAREYDRSEADMAAFCRDYVRARECFLTPWQKIDTHACPKRTDNTCYCHALVAATPGS